MPNCDDNFKNCTKLWKHKVWNCKNGNVAMYNVNSVNDVNIRVLIDHSKNDILAFQYITYMFK